MTEQKITPAEYVLQLMQKISTTQLRDLNQAQNALHEWLSNLSRVQPHVSWDLRLTPTPDNENDTTMDIIVFDGQTIRSIIIDSHQLQMIPITVATFLLQLHYKNTLAAQSSPKVARVERLVKQGALRTGGHINKDLIDLCLESL